MYQLNSGIKVIPYEELKPNISNTLLEIFLKSNGRKLEEKIEFELYQKVNKLLNL